MVGEGMSFDDVRTYLSALSCLKWGDEEGICLTFLTAFHRDVVGESFCI
jgi:hypothetical protein